MNRINEIGNTKDGQRKLGGVFARAHNRKNRCDDVIAEPYRQDAKDHWEGIEIDALSTAAKNSKDKRMKDFVDGAQEYYKHHNFGDFTIESKNMNKKLIRLTESDLHRIVKESVNRVLKENDMQNLGINNYDPTNYDELSSKIKTIMSKVGEVRNMIRDISTSQIDVAQNASNLDGLAEELYRQLRHTLQKANTNGWVEA